MKSFPVTLKKKKTRSQGAAFVSNNTVVGCIIAQTFSIMTDISIFPQKLLLILGFTFGKQRYN